MVKMVLVSATTGNLMRQTHLFPLLATGDLQFGPCVEVNGFT